MFILLSTCLSCSFPLQVFAYLNLLLSHAETSKKLAFQKQRLQEEIRQADEAMKRAATKRNKELRRRIIEEKELRLKDDNEPGQLMELSDDDFTENSEL